MLSTSGHILPISELHPTWAGKSRTINLDADAPRSQGSRGPACLHCAHNHCYKAPTYLWGCPWSVAASEVWACTRQQHAPKAGICSPGDRAVLIGYHHRGQEAFLLHPNAPASLCSPTQITDGLYRAQEEMVCMCPHADGNLDQPLLWLPQLTRTMRLLTRSSFSTGSTCLAPLFQVSSRIADNSLSLHGEGRPEETTALRSHWANSFPMSFRHLRGLPDKYIKLYTFVLHLSQADGLGGLRGY